MMEGTNEIPHADYGGDLLAGDEVKIIESRPISKTKKWEVLKSK